MRTGSIDVLFAHYTGRQDRAASTTGGNLEHTHTRKGREHKSYGVQVYIFGFTELPDVGVGCRRIKRLEVTRMHPQHVRDRYILGASRNT